MPRLTYIKRNIYEVKHDKELYKLLLNNCYKYEIGMYKELTDVIKGKLVKKDSKKNIVVLAYMQKRFVGWYYVAPSSVFDRRGWTIKSTVGERVLWIWIKPIYRRHGYGTRLIRHVISNFTTRKYMVSPHSTAALKLFKHLNAALDKI